MNGLIPSIDDDLMNDVLIEEQPTRTYQLKMNENKMGAYTDELEAMKQAIYHIINTERYQHLIYSWNYGIELADLFGKPVSYCFSEIKRRIKEALLQDERITDVHSFELSHIGGDVLCKFVTETIFGKIESERRIAIA